MPFYKKLTEYCAKKIFNPDFPIIEINRNTSKLTISNFLKIHENVIIKVDEFVKRRGKNGLVKKTNDVDKIVMTHIKTLELWTLLKIMTNPVLFTN